jgi:hypothetical protein
MITSRACLLIFGTKRGDVAGRFGRETRFRAVPNSELAPARRRFWFRAIREGTLNCALFGKLSSLEINDALRNLQSRYRRKVLDARSMRFQAKGRYLRKTDSDAQRRSQRQLRNGNGNLVGMISWMIVFCGLSSFQVTQVHDSQWPDSSNQS